VCRIRSRRDRNGVSGGIAHGGEWRWSGSPVVDGYDNRIDQLRSSSPFRL
jgi:hypothetical protein